MEVKPKEVIPVPPALEAAIWQAVFLEAAREGLDTPQKIGTQESELQNIWIRMAKLAYPTLMAIRTSGEGVYADANGARLRLNDQGALEFCP